MPIRTSAQRSIQRGPRPAASHRAQGQEEDDEQRQLEHEEVPVGARQLLLEPCASRRHHANSAIAAAAVLSPEARKRPPIAQVSLQTGWLLTAQQDSRVSGDEEPEARADDHEEPAEAAAERIGHPPRQRVLEPAIEHQRLDEGQGREDPEDGEDPRPHATSATST